MVVQWKASATTSAWVQQAGRAARAPGHVGLAVLLVEKTMFHVTPTAPAIEIPMEKSTYTPAQHGGQGQGRGGGGERGKKGADYAVLHGQKCGMCSGAHDKVNICDEPPLLEDAPAEGLYVLVQTTICWRAVLAKVFGNELPHISVSCYYQIF